MPRMDVYRMPGASPGYVVDVQSDLLSALPTRAVVPLVARADAPDVAAYLNPVFELHDVAHVLLPQYIASVPASALHRPFASLASERDTVTRALDRLLTDV